MDNISKIDLNIDGGEIGDDKNNQMSRLFDSWSEIGFTRDFRSLIGLLNKGDLANIIDEKLDKSITMFLSENILERYIDKSYGKYYYRFTKFGEKVRDYYLNEYLK